MVTWTSTRTSTRSSPGSAGRPARSLWASTRAAPTRSAPTRPAAATSTWRWWCATRPRAPSGTSSSRGCATRRCRARLAGWSSSSTARRSCARRRSMRSSSSTSTPARRCPSGSTTRPTSPTRTGSPSTAACCTGPGRARRAAGSRRLRRHPAASWPRCSWRPCAGTRAARRRATTPSSTHAGLAALRGGGRLVVQARGRRLGARARGRPGPRARGSRHAELAMSNGGTEQCPPSTPALDSQAVRAFVLGAADRVAAPDGVTTPVSPWHGADRSLCVHRRRHPRGGPSASASSSSG